MTNEEIINFNFSQRLGHALIAVGKQMVEGRPYSPDDIEALCRALNYVEPHARTLMELTGVLLRDRKQP